MSVSPAFRYSMMIGAITGAIVGMLFPMFCFGLGAFRPGYSPAVLTMLYDFGYLAFIGSLGCFCVMWMAFGLAIILDENNILPKWLGYYTIWQYVTELMAAPVWIAKSGPFAWNGLMTFWFAMIALCFVAVPRVPVHLQGDQEPTGGRTRQRPRDHVEDRAHDRRCRRFRRPASSRLNGPPAHAVTSPANRACGFSSSATCSFSASISSATCTSGARITSCSCTARLGSIWTSAPSTPLCC